MAMPYTFSNTPGDANAVPDANKFNSNNTYLLGLITGGQAIKSDTMANLVTAAAAAPTTAFLAIPTDLRALLLYTGVATAGPNADGFVTLVSWETIS